MKNSLIQEIFEISEKECIPLNVIIEVTRRCNIFCRHCYIPENSPNNELSKKQIFKLLDRLAEAGTLFITFTGGEPFIRTDFLDLIEYAKKKNFDITIFTNGTLLNRKIIKNLSDFKPSNVAISIYGSRPETHDYFTQCPGSFARSVEALRLLNEYGLSTSVKFLVMKDNIEQKELIKDLAEEVGAKLKTDPFVLPQDNGDCKPLDLCVSYEKISDEFFRGKNITKASFGSCSAGRNLAAIFADGKVSPCLLINDSWGNIKDDDFSPIWKTMNEKVKKHSLSQYSCFDCRSKEDCSFCPVIAQLLNMNPDKCPLRVGSQRKEF